MHPTNPRPARSRSRATEPPRFSDLHRRVWLAVRYPRRPSSCRPHRSVCHVPRGLLPCYRLTGNDVRYAVHTNARLPHKKHRPIVLRHSVLDGEVCHHGTSVDSGFSCQSCVHGLLHKLLGDSDVPPRWPTLLLFNVSRSQTSSPLSRSFGLDS